MSDDARTALLERGQELGCLEFSEVQDAVADLGLDDEGFEAVCEAIETRGIALRDDCGRQALVPLRTQ